MVRTEDDQPDHRFAASASKGFIRRESLHWLALAVGVAAVCLALRAPDKAYRTTPLKGLWTHVKGGFFHDGRFATLDQVVAHYDSFFGLGLSAQDQADLVQYLLSL